jgi:protein involved in polysaccharide export with SLBB domain
MINQCQKYWIIGVLLLCTSFSFTYQHLQAQTAMQVEQAKAKLSTMTPDEIKAAVAKYGMTMEEAQAKASAVGIDLESYLKNRSANEAAAAQPQTQVNIQVTPTQGTPAGTTVQPAVSTSGNPALGAPIQSTQNIDTTKQGAQTPVAPAPLVTAPVVQAPEQSKPPKEAAPIMGPGGIPYFGYNLFKAGPSAFEAQPNFVDNLYIVGEGDVLRIALWGDTQSMYEYTVDTEGRILVQPAGPVLVAGYTLDQAKARVIRALSQSLSGLVAKPPTTFLDLTIARLRPVRAFIMGEVANPGTYSLNSFTTVFNSLFSAGGPLVSGGLRDVRLLRSGKTVARVDLYDYLIGADRTKDIRVNDNDIIYVPLRGRTVGIKGAVLRSANFELLPNEQLRKLLDFSGGIRNTFYLQRIQIDRIIPFAERQPGELERKIIDIDFSDILLHGKDYTLEDGDIVTIYPIQDEKENYVNIDGAVWKPGTYQLEKVHTIKDLIEEADSLMPDAYMDRAKLVRTYEDYHTDVFYVDLNKAMKGDTHDNMELESWDRLRVFSWQEVLANPDSVRVEGMAKSPGTYPIYRNYTLYNLVNDYAGLSDTLFRPRVYLQRADLVRLNADRYTSRIIPFNLWDLYHDHINDTLLLAGDRVIIYPITAVQFTDRYVDIGGSVKSPGRYRLSENMTVLDLLIEAGGYTEEASTDQAEISRIDRKGIGKDSLTHIMFVSIPDFFDPQALSQEKIDQYRAASFKLQHRDQVFIRPDPNYIFQKSVTINGEVNHPGTYVLSKLDEHLTDIIKRAGGIKNGGYAEGGRVERGGTRMRINVRNAIEDPAGNDDIMMQSSDVVTIPKQPFAVTVTGEVNNPGLFSYVDGKSTSFYIKGSGGVTDSADFILVTFPTGISKQVGTHWWSANPDIPDGSSIFVAKEKPAPPEVVPKDKQTTTYEFIKDMLAIVVSAATIVVLANKL